VRRVEWGIRRRVTISIFDKEDVSVCVVLFPDDHECVLCYLFASIDVWYLLILMSVLFCEISLLFSFICSFAVWF
jgi:hypothetical protein